MSGRGLTRGSGLAGGLVSGPLEAPRFRPLSEHLTPTLGLTPRGLRGLTVWSPLVRLRQKSFGTLIVMALEICVCLEKSEVFVNLNLCSEARVPPPGHPLLLQGSVVDWARMVSRERGPEFCFSSRRVSVFL